MSTTSVFFNQSFDKKRLKTFLYWVFKTFGEKEALSVVEQLKSMGFSNATKAGLSIGLHDLKTPYKKRLLISHAQKTMKKTDQEFQGAEVTATERAQRIVDTWHRTSEHLKKQVVDYFSTYDQLNSVYMMALSGARGNFSQVRQLIGMRGLMADPQGQIISFPIRSNLREGLTLTEYFISCSGARKGLVDTALRTADTGYLTRRLVDISHHIVVKKVTCYTSRGIALKALRTSQKVLLPLQDRLVGRVLAENIYSNDPTQLGLQEIHPEQSLLYKEGNIIEHYRVKNNKSKERLEKLKDSATLIEIQEQIKQNTKKRKVIARKNQEISPNLALTISLAKETALQESQVASSTNVREMTKKSSSSQTGTLTLKSTPQVLVRSPLTCTYTHEICQLCYGWSMAQGSLVSLGEAVGVIAGQSIGEPGTQLTMRTFHTGGVFSGDLLQEIRAPHSGKIVFPKALQGLLIRTSQGKIAFLIKVSGELLIDKNVDTYPLQEQDDTSQKKATRLPLAPSTILFVRQGERVKSQQILAELAITTEEGNQPIKSRQTLFSEMRGRIVQWKSMSSRMHRTKTIAERTFYENVVSKRSFGQSEMDSGKEPNVKGRSTTENKHKVDLLKQEIDQQSSGSNFVPASSLIGSKAVLSKKGSEKATKTGIKTCLGPVEATPNYGSSVLQKSNSINQVWVAEQNDQHYEETWGNLKNLTFKKIVLAKKHGFGSVEPPKALKLGLLSVIATRVGASEKTCTKSVTSHQKGTLLPTLKKGIAKKAVTGLTLPLPFTAYINKKLENPTYLNGKDKNLLILRITQNLLDLNAKRTRMQYLNTIAEEGDLVDESYNNL